MQEKAQRLKKEAGILNTVAHKHIVKVHGISLWPYSFGIVTEYLPGGTLDELLKKKSVKISWDVKLRTAFQLSEAICFLYNGNSSKIFVHGDIKPENILLTLELSIKLADFGSANVARVTGASTMTLEPSLSKQHTPIYTAPEFLKNLSGPRTSAMDVYSFGMVLYEIVTRMRVYEEASLPLRQVVEIIRDTGQRPDCRPIDILEEDLKDEEVSIFKLLVESMKKSWSINSRDRPTIKAVYTSLSNEFCKVNEVALEEHIQSLVQSLYVKPKVVEESRATTLDCFRSPFEEALRLLREATTTNEVGSSNIQRRYMSLHCNLHATTCYTLEDNSTETTPLIPKDKISRSNEWVKRKLLVISAAMIVLVTVMISYYGLHSHHTKLSECPPLNLPSHVTKNCTEKNKINSYCEFSCDSRRELSGNSSSTCESSLTWSSPPPTCGSCLKCLTGIECQHSTSFYALFSNIKHVQPWIPFDVGYAGFQINCLINKHKGVLNFTWDCKCHEVITQTEGKCSKVTSMINSCKGALTVLVNSMVSKRKYPKPCDSSSVITDKCSAG